MIPAMHNAAPRRMRVGVDLGGTKIEAIALDDAGRAITRRRIDAPRGSYAATVQAVSALVVAVEAEIGGTGSVGIGLPGAISRGTGLVKNANSTWLNGQPFGRDVSAALGREVRLANDADCFALSEATDGAGAGHDLVFGVILGTGVGGGIVRARRLLAGPNGIAGEWGHNEMPARAVGPLPETLCFCGRRRCIETYLSGPALAADHAGVAADLEASGREARAIAALAESGDAAAQATLGRYFDRLAAALGGVINLLDPDVIVLGGGLSNIAGICHEVTLRLPRHVFSDGCETSVVRHHHGDSSGVRGAAWLWPIGQR